MQSCNPEKTRDENRAKKFQLLTENKKERKHETKFYGTEAKAELFGRRWKRKRNGVFPAEQT
jgi:hypothetical protein